MTEKKQQTKDEATVCVNGLVSDNFGKKLKDIVDVDQLRNMVGWLWGYLDDIDTLDDMAKNNDLVFRNTVRSIQKQRFNHLVSDGYNLFLPPS